jgi:hypothetical protein
MILISEREKEKIENFKIKMIFRILKDILKKYEVNQKFQILYCRFIEF